MITSPQNPRVKDAVRLRDGRHRRKQRRFLIDGIRELGRALDGGIELIEVFYCLSKCTRHQAGVFTSMWGDLDAEITEVSPEVFDKLAFGDRAEGVIAVAKTPRARLDVCPLSEVPLVAVIEGIEKPGNVGAVVRSADAAGLDAVIVANGRTDLFNPNAIRASLGTIFTLPVCEATTAKTLAWLRRNELAVYAAQVDGAVPYTEVDYGGPAAIVLGSEAKGLSSAWSDGPLTTIRLPMLGAADSLNISATAAVLFYEALRQRSAK
jgi:TrmH family RNA methyltransferase